MFRVFPLLATLLMALPSIAEELTAREIMERVDARDDGDYSTQDFKMVLIDKRGNQRVRELRSFGRDEGEDEGEHVDHHDAPAIRNVVRHAAINDYRFSSLVLGIIESTPFQMRRSQ